MNRKGQTATSEIIIWTVVTGIFTVLLFILGFTIQAFINTVIEVPPRLEAELISLRFTTIPECFAFQDETTGKVVPGVIDLDKFTNEGFNTCYKSEALQGIQSLNFRLKLEKSGQEAITDKYAYKDDFALFKEVLVKRESMVEKDLLVIYVQKVSR